MASLWKHPKSNFWTACFTDEAGRRRKRSTKKLKRSEAQKIADTWEAAYRRKISRGQAHKVLSEMFDEGGQAETTMEKFARGWLDELKPSVSPSTYSVYSNGINHFLASMGERAALPILHLSRADIARYKKALAAGHPVTGNQRLKLVKMLLKAAREDGCSFDDPFIGLKLFKEEQNSPDARRPFSVPELQRLLAAADGEWRSLILFGLYTGQRLGDSAALRWSQIDIARGELSIITKKTGRRMLIPINTALAEHLATLPAADDPKAMVHPRAAALVAGAKGKVSTLSRHFGELLESAGLRTVEELPAGASAHDGKGKGRSAPRKKADLSFHCLRHTARSLLEAAGVPLATAMQLLGHSDTGASLGYVHVENESLRRAAESMRIS